MKLCSLLILVICVNFFAFAQSKKELENKKKQLQREINFTDELIKETKKSQQSTLDELIKISKKINIREDLIRTVQVELNLINAELEKSEIEYQTLSQNLLRLKEDYAKMIYFSQKNQSALQKLMFIFSADDFNKAYARFKYFKQYATYRKKQAFEIQSTQIQIESKKVILASQRRSKIALLGIEEKEKEKLALEKNEEEQMLSVLQKKEKDLLARKKEKEEEQKRLELAIKRIIEEEIRTANEKAKKQGKSESKTLTLTPEALKLSSTFESNKNILPWPVAKGIITGKFGRQPHPVLNNITINNNGIDISTEIDAKVRAVFEGEVTGLAVIPGFGNVIMIRHGEYLSVYSNLKDVFVKKGDKISTKQEIGIVDNEENSKSELHFEIWKGSNVQDPETWILRQ